MRNVLAIGLSAACLAAVLPRQSSPLPTIDRKQLSIISARLATLVEERKIAGAVTLLAVDGSIVLHDVVGQRNIEKSQPMTRQTIFRVASMTKSVTATAVMMLVEDGLLVLNDPIARSLPEYASLRVSPSAAQVGSRPPKRAPTVRDLLAHVSGLPRAGRSQLGDSPARSLEELAAWNSDESLLSDPGDEYRYSNLGYQILGRVIEVASGKQYDEFVRERILEPLGMRNSFFNNSSRVSQNASRVASIYELSDGSIRSDAVVAPPQYEFPSPSGGLLSTAEDMFSFYQMILSRGVHGDVRLLSRASVDAMTKAHVTVSSARLSGYGLGFWVVTEPVGTVGLPLQYRGAYGHSGFWSSLGWVDPARRLVGVFLVQRAGPVESRVALYEMVASMAGAAVN